MTLWSTKEWLWLATHSQPRHTHRRTILDEVGKKLKLFKTLSDASFMKNQCPSSFALYSHFDGNGFIDPEPLERCDADNLLGTTAFEFELSSSSESLANGNGDWGRFFCTQNQFAKDGVCISAYENEEQTFEKVQKLS